MESLLPDGWLQNCDQYLAEISLSNSSGICFLVYRGGVERDRLNIPGISYIPDSLLGTSVFILSLKLHNQGNNIIFPILQFGKWRLKIG